MLPFHSALGAPVRVVAKPDVTGNLLGFGLGFITDLNPTLIPTLTLTLTLTPTLTLAGNLASPLNFARFELPRLLPALRRLLYLDPDVVVQADLLELCRNPSPNAKP